MVRTAARGAVSFSVSRAWGETVHRSRRRAAIRLVTVAVVLSAFAWPAAALAATAPALVGSATNSSSLSGATAVAVSGRYAFTTAYWPGQLTVLDISTPGTPTVVGSTLATPSLENGSNVTVAGTHVFVVSKNRNASASSNDDGSGNSLTVVDVSTPTSPTVTGTVHVPSQLFGSYGVAVSGQYAYVASQGILTGQPTTPDTSYGAFSVIDLSTMTVVGHIDNGPPSGTNYLKHSTSVAISGNYAYVTAFYDSRVTVINISNPASPTVVTSLRDATNLPWPADLAVQGHDLYVANQSGSFSNHEFTVIDITNPASPSVVASLSDPRLFGAYRIRVRGDFAYLSANSTATIAAIDISNPASPRIAGAVTDSTHLNSTSGLDLDPSGRYVIASSPALTTDFGNSAYPPFTNTNGTISTIDLDPSPIAVQITSGPPNPDPQTSANFAFAANDMVSAVQCSLDGAAFVPCTSPTTQQYNGLGTGGHTFRVQATDAAGNTATVSYPWTVGNSLNAAPKNISPPTISGSAAQGGQLKASPGTWSGSPSPSFSYQWRRCDQNAQHCNAIPGAAGTGSTYAVQSSDAGSTFEVKVTATNGSGSASATSAPSGRATGQPLAHSAPGTSGTAQQGDRLTGINGSWSGYPAPAFAYRWQRCNAAVSHCTTISGQTTTAYTLSKNDVGSRIRFVVSASNSSGSSSATSAATAVVARLGQFGRLAKTQSARLAGIASGKASLHITLVGANHGVLLGRVVVALPRGMSFVSSHRGVPKGITVGEPRGPHVGVLESLVHGSLVLTMRKPAASIQLAIGGPAMAVSPRLATSVKEKKTRTLTLALTITVASHGSHTTKIPLNLRVA